MNNGRLPYKAIPRWHVAAFFRFLHRDLGVPIPLSASTPPCRNSRQSADRGGNKEATLLRRLPRRVNNEHIPQNSPCRKIQEQSRHPSNRVVGRRFQHPVW